MSRILLIVLTLIIIVGGLYLGISALLSNQNSDTKPVTLTIWGIKEDPNIMNNVIIGYRKLHPNVTINYSTQTLENYRTRVQTQIASGQAADIIAIHNSWLPMFYQTGSLAPSPDGIWADYNSLFYKVVVDSFVRSGKIYGIPMEIDGLALFYNQDILKAQNIGLPKTWDDVVNAAVLTTVVDKNKQVQTGGLGLGNTSNVDYWSEIIGTLFLQQPNASLEQPNNSAGQEVIQFFKNPTGGEQKTVWDQNMDNTTKAFAEGKLTFYLAPAGKIEQIKKANPSLNFGVMSVPQLPDKNAALACFWGYGVASSSKNQKAAWQFLKFLTDQATEQYINQQETAIFGLGRPYPRKDLQSAQASDQYLGAFVKQGDYYQTFPLCPETQDNGLNDQMISAYKTGVDSGNLTDLQTAVEGILAKFSTPVTK